MKRTGSETATYVMCALLVLPGAAHLSYLRGWPGWHAIPPPAPLAYAIEFLPVVGLLIAAVSLVLNAKGYGAASFRLAFWVFVPAPCVMVLDGFSGAIGFVD